MTKSLHSAPSSCLTLKLRSSVGILTKGYGWSQKFYVCILHVGERIILNISNIRGRKTSGTPSTQIGKLSIRIGHANEKMNFYVVSQLVRKSEWLYLSRIHDHKNTLFVNRNVPLRTQLQISANLVITSQFQPTPYFSINLSMSQYYELYKWR